MKPYFWSFSRRTRKNWTIKMNTNPKTLKEALDQMEKTDNPRDRWELLTLILREFMLSQGVDLDHKIKHGDD